MSLIVKISRLPTFLFSIDGDAINKILLVIIRLTPLIVKYISHPKRVLVQNI